MIVRLPRYTLALLLLGASFLAGCGGGAQDHTDADTTGMAMDHEAAMMPQSATAELSPTEGNSVEGTVTFTATNGAVGVESEITNLSPGLHGFHIHENGDCSAPDASSAGGHYNPTDAPHGAPDDAERHVGDLGNIVAGSDSTAAVSIVDGRLSLSGVNTIVGRAVVVHSGEDDQTSQPSGDAGSRVACGVIESS